MSPVNPVRPIPSGIDADRPTTMSGLLFGLLLAVPLWAAILAFIL
ncbi:hypothetical protein QLH51_03350 [Sphingomonas sp. 2R-10]|nr:hypothetical protein [Sphingomonas sp. 2R-10]MDJ0275843.1 hypothetical protein [Sphingomonas sp. 2R-10]